MRVGRRKQQGRGKSKKLVCPSCGAYYMKNLYMHKKGVMSHCGFFCEGCSFAEFFNTETVQHQKNRD